MEAARDAGGKASSPKLWCPLLSASGLGLLPKGTELSRYSRHPGDVVLSYLHGMVRINGINMAAESFPRPFFCGVCGLPGASAAGSGENYGIRRSVFTHE